MKPYTLVVLIIAVVATTSQAQPTSRRAGHDTKTLEAFCQQIHQRLFSGIALSRSQDSVARQLIYESLVKRDALDSSSPLFLDDAKAIVGERDAAIRTLLLTTTDQSVFDRNARVPIFLIDSVRRQPPRT
jgi:hypothetical protein